MIDGKHDFQLSATELNFLNQLASCDESVAGLLGSRGASHSCGATIRLSRADAERLRDLLTTQLAIMGFDENYLPNEQGRILEALIDRFYLC